jgi:predicted extracellular nuclease
LGCGGTTTCSATALGNMVDLVGYGTVSLSEGSATGALSSTTAALRQSSGCNDTDNNGTDFAVGTPAPRNSGSPLNVCVTTAAGMTPIYTIQGTSPSSSYDGLTVTTQGVVTKVHNNGFYMQDATGDGLDTTSDGIFVFTSTTPTVSVGQLVQISGEVDEFDASAGASAMAAARPLTELKNVSSTTVLGSGNITAKLITLPEAFDDELERYEGMLVTINTPLTASQNFFQGRYGQVTLGANGRLFKPTTFYRPGTPEAIHLKNLNQRSSILLDDGTSQQNTNPTPYIGADNTLRAGDTVPSITGVIDYGLATNFTDGIADYKIHPTQPVTFTRANSRPAAAPAVGGNVKVASFNVLNYFNGDGAGGGFPTSRGASTLAEFNRQRSKIITALATLNADVVGLMEIENDGSGSTSAIQDLVNGLNAVLGTGTYAVVPAPAAGFGTDEIKVALLYKPGTLALVGASLSDTDPVHNRPPVAQGFALLSNGEKFGVVVNHFKSKRCDAATGLDSDQGDGQGCYNNLRKQQSTRLLTFIGTLQSHIGDSDVAVIGDLNAYGLEDPVDVLTQAGLVNQTAAFSSAPYSFVFDGEAGYLDHALTTATLSPKVSGVSEWHINADEPAIIDYNLEFKQPACATCGPDYYTNTVYRSSDHDPVVIGLTLVTQAAQSITFPGIANQLVNASAVSLSATASSGLSINYTSLTPSVCSITAPAALNVLTTGTCTVSANQSGNAFFLPAANVNVSFQVTQVPQTLTFDAINSQIIGGSLSLSATASSGLPVSYSSLTPATCTVAGNVAQFMALGTCSLQANQMGNNVYETAPAVVQSFSVNANGGSDPQEGDVPIGPFWLVVQALGLAAAGVWHQRKKG